MHGWVQRQRRLILSWKVNEWKPLPTAVASLYLLSPPVAPPVRAMVSKVFVSTSKIPTFVAVTGAMYTLVQSHKIRSDIDIGDRYGRSDINEIPIGISMWIWIIDMGHGLSIWLSTISIWSSWIWKWEMG